LSENLPRAGHHNNTTLIARLDDMGRRRGAGGAVDVPYAKVSKGSFPQPNRPERPC
jgi:hypothetical protein